jgi:hypothetical protein
MLVETLNVRGSCRVELGDYRGLDDIRQGIAIGLEYGLAGPTSACYNNLSDALWGIEGPASALAAIDKGVAFADARELRIDADFMRVNRVLYLIDLGRWNDALRLIDPTFATEEEPEGQVSRTGAISAKAFLLALGGNNDEAAVVVENILASARMQDTQALTLTLMVAAVVKWRSHRLREAVEFVEELHSLLQDLTPRRRAENIPFGVRIALAASKPHLARL